MGGHNNSFYNLTFADNTLNQKTGQPEHATFEVAITPLISNGDNTSIEAAVGNLVTAIQAIEIGNIVNKTFIFQRDKLADVPASSPLSQRENKWLCRYHSTVTLKKFRVSIPCADLTKLANNSEFLVLTGGPGATLKTNFEAVVVDPDDNVSAVVLDSVQFVGRNS